MEITGLIISDTRTMLERLTTSRFAKLERGSSKEIPEER